MPTTDTPPGVASRERASRLVKRGGLLLFLGLLAYGAMFVSFGITDTDPFEVLGGAGWMVAGLGSWLVASGVASRWTA